MKRVFLIFGLILLGPAAWWGVPFFTMGPSQAEMDGYRNSPQFDRAAKRFRNPVAEPEPEAGERDSFGAILADFLFPPGDRRPDEPLPEHALDAAALAEKSEAVRFAWLGHSTILLELDGQRVLIDPVFAQRASPVPFTATRFQPPAWPLSALTDAVDAVVISHNHYDHLDEPSIRQLARGGAVFLVPLGVGEQLATWGIAADRVIELDWWDSHALGRLTLTATPAQHFSGRGLTDRNKTLWASWVAAGTAGTVFFSGDSGYGPHYRAIGEALGPFDLTFIENGAYSTNWPFVHHFPEQAVQAHRDLRGRLMVPVHWGMFALGPHPWEEPAQRAAAESDRLGVDLLAPQIGQLLAIDGELPRDRWWDKLAPSR